jgi:hypothetical protein
MLQDLQAPTIAAPTDREFRIKGEAHGQESTVRGYYLYRYTSRRCATFTTKTVFSAFEME